MKVRFSVCAISAILALFVVPSAKLSAATPTVPPGACLYALDSTAADAFQIAGAQSVYTACGVVAESSSSSAFEMEGAETLYLENHAQVSVVGGADLTGQTYLYDTIGGKDVSAVKTSNPGDPLSNLSPPTSGAMAGKSPTYYDMNSKPANNTISPGIYCGGLTIGNTNGATFTFSPGTYIMAGGGLTLESEAVVKGTGVTFYNTSSAGWGCSSSYNYTPITISGQVNATFSAPTSGAFDGILFFGNRTGCSTAGSCVDQINGGSTAILNGALYFKSDKIEITGANASGYTMLVADKIYINGNSNFGENGSPFDDITVSVSPAAASIFASQTQQFTATVDNTGNTAVTWTISPSSAGSISSSGLYTAPSSITAQQTVTATATSQADNTKTGSATITLLPPQTPVITWAAPAAITYGTALSATQLDATANVPGAFTYTPAAGTVLAVGSQTLSVTFTPKNTAEYTTVTASVTLTVNKATPVIAWATPGAITYGTALSATQLDATANVAGTFTYSPAAGSVMNAGTQTLTTTFTPTNTTDYTTVTASVTLMVNQAAPTVTWATPAAITYGTALSSTQLDATANLPGAFTYSPAVGIVLATGSQTLTVNFTPTDATDYKSATASVTLMVNQAAPVITWATPAAIRYGTALTSTQLDATANVAGAFAYSPSAGTVLPAGSQTLNVTFTPSDTTDYATATASVPLTVNLAAPTISISNLPASGTYGGSFAGVIAYSGNGSPTETTASNTPAVCAVSGMLVSYIGAGACSLTASASATADYGAVTGSAQSFTVGQAALTVKASSPTVIYGSAVPAIAPSYSGFVNGDTASVLNAAPACTTTYTTTSPAGSSPSTSCSGAAAANYTFTYVNGSVNVTQANQTITFTAPASPVTYGASAMALNASASSGLAVSFSASGPCSVSGSTLTITGAGTCTVTVSQAGNSNYAAATAVSHSVAAIPAPLTITASSAAATYGAAVPAITPSYAGFVNGDTASALTTAPTCSTTYTTASAPGSYPSSCSGAADANYAISYVSGAVTVNQTTPAIAWATLAAIAYGTPLSATQLNATANVPGTFVYSPVAGTVLAVGSQTLTATFTPTDTTDYATATASVVLTVNQATPTITWTTPTAITAGTALGSTQLDATVNVAGTFAYSPAAGTVLSAGNQTLNVTFTPTDITDYATATASVVLTVNQATQCNTNGYGYVRAIVIDHTKVPNTDQIDFPFLFSTTDPLLATTANSGHVSNPNGYDIIFTSDPGGQNPLPYEMEEYNPATGQVVAWVQIPDLSHTSDTVIYLFYGNPNVTASQQNPTAVWDSNFVGVWHLPNGSVLSANDSTINGNNGTPGTGVAATAGIIDGGASFNGAGTAYISIPSSSNTWNFANDVTVSAWIKTTSNGTGIVDFSNGSPLVYLEVGQTIWGGGDPNKIVVYTQATSGGILVANGNTTVNDNNWHHIEAVRSTGNWLNIYVDGKLDSSTPYTNPLPMDISGGQVSIGGFNSNFDFIGNIDEVRVSNVARSADWIAVEYANQSSPSTFFNLSTENIEISPASVSVYGAQTQQFTVTALTKCVGDITWSISGPGSITQDGLYTAPASITAQQTAVVTASDSSNPSIYASADITLLPPVAVSITPATATIANGGQPQQFAATVLNTSSTAVTWSVSSLGPEAGMIDQTGLYTAPESITSQQAVTVTATSQFDSTKSGSATITFAPPSRPSGCGANGYSYARTITIDHTKVPNTDQIDFPFLFSTTDPLLATTANGGHITNENAYDLIFTSDAAGLNPLPYEMEKYDPQTGTVIAWVQIPDISHTSDTTIYLFYGNTNITTTQQNPSAVWDSNYKGVWHLGNTSALSLNDSTSDGNNATDNGGVLAAGPIAGGMQTNGSTYATIGTPSSLANLAQGPATFSVWVNSAAGAGGILMGKDDHDVSAGWSMSLTASHNVEFVVVDESDFEVESTETTADNAWSYVVVTLNGSAAHSQTGTFYINGVPSGSSGSDGFGGTSDDSAQVAYLANAAFGNQGSAPFNGMTAEFRMSNTIRSADWIATEYANQNSPSTFSSLSPENQAMNPGTATLYAGQSQQFAVLDGPCNASVVWSISPSSSPLEVGTLTQTGPYSALYNAPVNIDVQQTVTITATAPGSSSSIATAAITLMPAIGVSITPPTAIVYPTQTQQFTATVSNTTDTAVNWTISPAGIGTIDANGLYTPPNINFSVGKFTATSLVLNAAGDGDPIVTPGGVLQLTDGGRAEDASAWYPAKVPVTAFSTNFSFQMLQSSGITFADGITFTIQGNGTNALGGGGGGLGYQGISDSVAIKFDTFNNSGEGTDSTGIFTDGTGPYIPAIDLTPTGIELQSGDVIDANLVYDGRNLTLMLADTVTQATAQEVFPIDIPSVLGSDTAYIGFTGSTGVGASTQNVLSWTYTSSSPKTIDVTATSAADSAVSATASVTLMPSIAISASPANVVLYGGQSQQFTANVTNTANTAVIWSIAPATGTGSVDASGLYSAPSAVTAPQTVTITAASVADPSVTTTLTLTLVPHVALSINPTGTTLFAGQSLQFTANVTGNSDTAVIWTVIPAPGTILANGLGTLNAGLYTAPASVPSQQALLITATSAANPTISATATVTLMPAQNAIGINLAATSPVTYPNSAQLTATVTDSSLPLGQTLTVQWTQLSGPGTITFGSAQTTSTTASFSEIGTYVVQLTASDSVNSASAQLAIVVSDSPSLAQGWIGSPANGSGVSGIVPITVAAGETLTSGTLTYYPANNPNDVTVLNANVSGSGQIGTLDTTALANGSYWIALQATDSNGDSQYSLALVTVTGSYKPGRVTTTVTDLVVPATGLPIQIQRTYDSLNAGTIGDFGYGWNLGINVNLVVDNKGDVTFTLGGQRKTFYLTPTSGGFLFPWYFPTFTPEPGLFGTLTDSGPGCVLDMLLPDGECLGGIGFYTPPGYIYTDPSGTQYTIGAGGQLQSIVDRSGNGLTIGPNGITSTTGLNVPFVRDAENRITQITDPAGNVYSYNYDANGDLVSVTYPPAQSSQVCAGASAPNTSQYTYAPNHYYESGTDGNCNPLPSTTYYAAGETDASGNYSVAGKLQSVTDGLGETTGYTYNLATNTTVVTYPPDAQGNIGTATMVYDSNGDVLSSTDPLGHTATNTYDASFNLLSTTDPLGHTTSYTYDANGNKTSTTYPATAASTNTTSATNYNQFSEPTSTLDEDGNTRTFAYDANFNPLAVTDAVGTLMSTQFNASGQMLSGAIGYDITQNPANASQFAYDANGNLISKTDALGRTTSYTYNALGQKLTMTEPVPTGSTAAAATTTYTYDAFGNLIETQAPLGRVTYSTYDANGNKLTDTDARGNVTSYQYDALNRLIETDYPDGTKATKTYDFRNNVVTETDQNGNVTLHQYDLAGRQVAVTQAYGAANATTTTTAYDNAGRMTSQTDALGHATNYTYDAAGNLLSTSGVAGNFSYTYDNARNRIAQTDGNGDTTKYQFDSRKRLTTTTYPDGTLKTNSYDGPGNLISVTDQAGNIVNYSYDAANQLSSVTESPSTSVEETTIYGYDANGNPIALEDANQHTTVNAFDLLSELTNKTLPDGTLTESRTYDANGNLSTVTHFNGVTTSYIYDQLNRLLSRATPGEAPVSFAYTPTGKRASMSDALGETVYSYDSMDRLVSRATPIGTLSYTYDAAGNLASMTSNHANGVSASYTYDSLNRLASVTDARLAGNGTTTYTYDNANNVGSVTYPNGIAMQFAYDLLNRVLSASSQVSSYQYQRGPTGNLTNAVELSGRTANWTYDGIYRLTNESVANDPSQNNGAVSYSLDPVGNRLSDTSSLTGITSGTWGYNSDDEVSSESYDANGNVTAADGKTFAYDSENHLTSMNGGAVSIIYDGDGNRVAKTVNGVTTYYLVDDLNPTGYAQVVEELSSAGTVERQYTYGLQRINENQILNGAWTPSFYGYDGGGNVRNLTNSAGAVTDSYEYDAYGNSFTVSGTTPNEMLYRGEQYDPDLGLYYLRARYYNPATGRFMGRDPQELCDCSLDNPASLHAYSYASADPVNRIDPSGRADVVDEEELDTIPLRVVSKTVVIAGLATGAGVGATAWTMTAAVLCLLQYDLQGIEAVTANLGPGEKFEFFMSGCRVTGSKMPYTPRPGAVPSPIGYPTLNSLTAPGGPPWNCGELGPDGLPDECWAPCSNGKTQKLHYDPGTTNGKGAHWDYTDCDGKTWYIWPDGTMTPAT